ncbi:hypothetical protein CKO08_07655 [Halorhodospira halochloris]|nr:hypothetical protein [Halorhodospira halochloris]
MGGVEQPLQPTLLTSAISTLAVAVAITLALACSVALIWMRLIEGVGAGVVTRVITVVRAVARMGKAVRMIVTGGWAVTGRDGSRVRVAAMGRVARGKTGAEMVRLVMSVPIVRVVAGLLVMAIAPALMIMLFVVLFTHLR